MSLATSAATWTTDDIPPPVATKKRQSTVRTATEIIGASSSGPAIFEYDQHPVQPKVTPPYVGDLPTVEQLQTNNEDRKVKVTDLLNKLTKTGGSTEGLVDYVPTTKDRMPTINDQLPREPVQLHKMPMILPTTPSTYMPSGYSMNSMGTTLGAAYTHNVPKHVKAKLAGSDSDDKLMEKINYMIHLLEEQKMEKTNYVMEEFVLYTMLGVFVIYVVDSFSRSAKYIR